MFRNIYLHSPAQISIDHYQLSVCVKDTQYHFPFDDIQSLLIENPKSVITASAIAQLAEHNITVITCDKNHLPISTLLPLQGSYQHLKTLQLQLKLTKRIKERITRKIIKQKILNQSQVIGLLTENPTVQQKLMRLASAIQDGDPDNREAVAAKIYFETLGGSDFSRRSEVIVNGALNYGFAILRSCIARELLQFGFEPALGFNHHNIQNAFNLADDLIEPLRPAVELYCFKTFNPNDSSELDSQIKSRLLNILNYEVLINNNQESIRRAIHLMVESLWSVCSEQKISYLALPIVQNLKVHDNGE
ncbi:type II CRISPR-associated endonuclease Cas1 [Levilactobacillus acidifarinae]|uniref:CRISPR-associated endonuclease Cas1 n=1 Tax=Levilactobacillus acidifarinae DSM 19394 = JCM 15949 TaxID=1423715 RepID=A0A0R1LNU5_9LACO|nr:type II CRISPR-associated endonuclease Cas1 [Levilactobacillus acidifarinae]KRK94481.1 CRISPR-associated protein Cas1 [Levilactobacillus acidifarinae DSM 19394]GEO68225.1 CRISPR-associated endonuclease Cas1 [Levilactobacillus acidifarinae]